SAGSPAVKAWMTNGTRSRIQRTSLSGSCPLSSTPWRPTFDTPVTTRSGRSLPNAPTGVTPFRSPRAAYPTTAGLTGPPKGAAAARDLAHLVIINPAGVFSDSVMRGAEQRPRKVHGRAVGQMAAVRQRQPEQRVARLRHREVRGHVRLGPGVRLDVHVLRLEQ